MATVLFFFFITTLPVVTSPYIYLPPHPYNSISNHKRKKLENAFLCTSSYFLVFTPLRLRTTGINWPFIFIRPVSSFHCIIISVFRIRKPEIDFIRVPLVIPTSSIFKFTHKSMLDNLVIEFFIYVFCSKLATILLFSP